MSNSWFLQLRGKSLNFGPQNSRQNKTLIYQNSEFFENLCTITCKTKLSDEKNSRFQEKPGLRGKSAPFNENTMHSLNYMIYAL